MATVKIVKAGEGFTALVQYINTDTALLIIGGILLSIVVIGTFALAMAFAANDLVNFIGVPMAGYHAYEAAMASDAPLSVTMGALDKKVPAETTFLMLASAVISYATSYKWKS